MKPIIIVGSKGRMSSDLQSLLSEKALSFKIFSKNTSPELEAKSFDGAEGIIDFSTPEAAKTVLKQVETHPIPWVCGTTGWNSTAERDEVFSNAAKLCPVLVDSNFSFGIELLCRSAEMLAQNLKGPFFITDYHHAKKKDSPSGTALKIVDRMKSVNKDIQIEFRDIRAGQIAGEHQIFVAWENECLQFLHRAQSRRVFSEGALYALDWLKKQKPGLYSMKDIR